MIMSNCLHRATAFQSSRRFTIAYKYRPYSPDAVFNATVDFLHINDRLYQQSLDCHIIILMRTV